MYFAISFRRLPIVNLYFAFRVVAILFIRTAKFCDGPGNRMEAHRVAGAPEVRSGGWRSLPARNACFHPIQLP
jgi:hypothetical protein